MPSVGDVEPSIEGDFTTGKLTRTDIEFFHAGLALSGVSRVQCIFATLNQCSCRGCNCSFNKLVQLAQVANSLATWVTDPIRILHGILN